MLKSVDQQGSLTDRETASLYGRLLGPDVARLHPTVAAVHCGGGTARLEGWLQVDRGKGAVSRSLAVLLRLPRPGEKVRTRLVIVRQHGGERWHRFFGDSPALCSIQSMGGTAELVERFRGIAFVFRVQAKGDALIFRQRCCRLHLGRRALRLPDTLAPRVAAEVAPAPGDRLAVSVRVTLPWAGPLLAYRGLVEHEVTR